MCPKEVLMGVADHARDADVDVVTAEMVWEFFAPVGVLFLGKKEEGRQGGFSGESPEEALGGLPAVLPPAVMSS